MRLLVKGNLHAAVYSALDQITANDMRGLCRETGYIASLNLHRTWGTLNSFP